jgi:hypothetical protein
MSEPRPQPQAPPQTTNRNQYGEFVEETVAE